MTRTGHSYLDLTALPDVGALLLAPAPAWLFEAEEGTLLWANAAGADHLGATSIAAALDEPAESIAPEDLSELAARATAMPAVAELRFPSADAARCLVQIVELGDGTNALLAAGIEDRPATAPLAVRAARLVESLASEEMVAAVCRSGGKVLAASARFASLRGIDAVVAAATERLDAGGVAKGMETIGDERRPFGLMRAETPEGPLLLVIAGPPVEETEPTGLRPDTDAGAASDYAPPAPTDPGRRRFTFRIDGDQRVTEISPDFSAIVGPRSADIVGKRWPDIVARLGIDTGGVVQRALTRRDTWSGVLLDWPVDDAEHRLSLSLTALPSFDARGGFIDFRGFGVVRTEAAKSDLPESSREREAEAEAAGASEVEEVAETAEAEPPSNVVVLPTAAEPPSGRAEPQPEQEGRRNLSGEEHDAFRRIAEALRAVGPSGNRHPAATSRPHRDLADKAADAAPPAPPSAEPPASPEATVPLKLLDRMPIGLLVYRDRQLLFANRALLDRLGYYDGASFAAAGGVDGLFAEAGESPRDGGASCTVPLRAYDGRTFAAEARLHIVPWDGGPATMLSIRDPGSAASRQWEPEQIDGGGHILNINRSGEALFGVEGTDVLGAPFTGLLAEESRQSALDYLDGLSANGVASVLNDGREVIGKVPSGGLIPIFMTMGRLSERDKFCAVLRDITHWKRAEEELVSARRAAESANQQKSEFLAKISHELRTPLNAIIGFSDIILEERFGPIGVERYREYLKDIRLSGTHLASLINDLLDLSRIESGKLDLSFEAVSLNGLIQDAVALLQPDANRRRIIIRTSLGGNVPRVVADQRSIRQILLNLLSNAVKFNAEGGQVIVSSALDAEGEVIIRIRDTGAGMTEAEIEKALKPFQQLATSGPMRFEGTGLGLPLTKALVEANRAQFDITSAPGEGTMIAIAFPVERVLQS